MSVDYSPLLVPVSRGEIAQFKRESRASGQSWALGTTVATVATIAVGAVMAVAALSLLAFTVTVAVGFFRTDGASPGVFILAPVILLAVTSFFAYRFIVHSGSRWESLLRRTRFAAANRLEYSTGRSNPDYPGLVFGLGQNRQTSDNYQSLSDPQFELGNYRYTTGSGDDKKSYHWGYLALRLERKLPHMVLDARGNNGLLGASTLPTSFRRNQKLSLEGDFDRYFTLYCPREYERDALYVFTPDLMALLIDESAAFDVEIVDDWMFVYSVLPLELDHPTTVQRMFRIIETVGAKTLRQTHRYADERIGDSTIDLVAPRGRRLKTGTTFAGIGIVVVFAWVAFSFVRAWL